MFVITNSITEDEIGLGLQGKGYCALGGRGGLKLVKFGQIARAMWSRGQR